MTIQFFIFLLINGITQGMLLFIIASGLSLVFYKPAGGKAK